MNQKQQGNERTAAELREDAQAALAKLNLHTLYGALNILEACKRRKPKDYGHVDACEGVRRVLDLEVRSRLRARREQGQPPFGGGL